MDSDTSVVRWCVCRVGQNHICIYIRCIHGIIGRELTKHMVMYNVYILVLCDCAS
jgi:hypothetical protein